MTSVSARVGPRSDRFQGPAYDPDMVNNDPEHEKIREEREAAQKEKDRLEAEEQRRLDGEG